MRGVCAELCKRSGVELLDALGGRPVIPGRSSCRVHGPSTSSRAGVTELAVDTRFGPRAEIGPCGPRSRVPVAHFAGIVTWTSTFSVVFGPSPKIRPRNAKIPTPSATTRKMTSTATIPVLLVLLLSATYVISFSRTSAEGHPGLDGHTVVHARRAMNAHVSLGWLLEVLQHVPSRWEGSSSTRGKGSSGACPITMGCNPTAGRWWSTAACLLAALQAGRATAEPTDATVTFPCGCVEPVQSSVRSDLPPTARPGRDCDRDDGPGSFPGAARHAWRNPPRGALRRGVDATLDALLPRVVPRCRRGGWPGSLRFDVWGEYPIAPNRRPAPFFRARLCSWQAWHSKPARTSGVWMSSTQGGRWPWRRSWCRRIGRVCGLSTS